MIAESGEVAEVFLPSHSAEKGFARGGYLGFDPGLTRAQLSAL